MNNTSSINYNSSYNSKNYLDYLINFCEKLWLNTSIIQKIKQNKAAHNQNSWKELFWAFSKMAVVYEETISKDKSYSVSNKETIQKTFFLLWINFIIWYLNYIRELLDSLKSSKMNIYTSEKILNLEEEIEELMFIIQEENPITNWTSMREYIDDFQWRIDDISNEIKWFNNKNKDFNKNKKIDQRARFLRIKAWSKFINSWNISNQDIYKIQKDLSPEDDITTTTKDVVNSIILDTKVDKPWLKALDLKDAQILKAIKSVQDREQDNANNFSIQLRSDLHLKYGEAKNDELYYNSLEDILKDKQESEVIWLNIVWYDFFHVINTQKLPNWKYSKIKIEFKQLDSNETKTMHIYWDTQKMISWQQAKIWIIQPDNSVKISFLNINNITNIWTKIKQEYKNQDIKKEIKPWFISKTKQFLTDKYNNFFSKKRA